MQVLECNLDTDALGTFTGEIERKQSPRETVLIKARLGVEKTGESIGITFPFNLIVGIPLYYKFAKLLG